MENLKDKIQKHNLWINHRDSGEQMQLDKCVIESIKLLNNDINTSIYSEVQFKNLTIHNVNLSGSSWFNCEFENIDFEKVNLRKTEFHQCKFTNCNFKDCNISKSEFYDTEISNSNYFFTDLKWAYVANCLFNNILFQKIEVENLIFLDCNFSKTKFSDITFSESYPLKYIIGTTTREVRQTYILNELAEF